MVAPFAPKAGEIWTGSSHFAADQLKADRLLEMPLVRKMAKDLWEIRIHLTDRIARVLFNVAGHTMVLLHGFLKKSQATPSEELAVAKRRLQQLRSFS